MEVFLYQFGILFCIVLSSVIFGKNGLIYSAIAATVWTGVMVLTSWLFILQSVTVFVGLVIGGVIVESENHKRIQSSARELLATTLVIGAGILWFYHNKSTSGNTGVPGIQANQQHYNSLGPTETKQYPVMPQIKTVPPYIGKNSQQVPFTLTLSEALEAAGRGDPAAQNQLGFVYTHGQGVSKNYATALYWYHKSADQGFDKAQNNIGRMYEHGFGVPKNYATAMLWYQKAAEQKYAIAQYGIGNMYANGLGVTQDNTTAALWFKKAADQEYAAAQYNMGVLYNNGQGVPQSFATAAQWFQKAADQGDAEAQNKLGLMYANGNGVPQDVKQAAMWFQKAIENGNDAADINMKLMFKNNAR